MAPTLVHEPTLLLVDDEQNVLSALRRLLRTEGYRILIANGGEAGIEILNNTPVDVVMSDQRMPGMPGVEFLRAAREIQPECVRIVLSGYTDLEAVTNAINEGAIYKFLCKPWDDEHLKANLAEAFARRRLTEENRRLGRELADKNAQLETLLEERSAQVRHRSEALDVFHEVLEALPVGVVGVDEDGQIAFCNDAAAQLLSAHDPQLSMLCVDNLPASVSAPAPSPGRVVTLAGKPVWVTHTDFGTRSTGHGCVITLVPAAPSQASDA